MAMTVVLLVLTGVVLAAYLIRRRARLNWLRGTKTPTSMMLNLSLKSTALATAGVSLGAAALGDIGELSWGLNIPHESLHAERREAKLAHPATPPMRPSN